MKFFSKMKFFFKMIFRNYNYTTLNIYYTYEKFIS